MLGNNYGQGPGKVEWPQCGEIDIMEHIGPKDNQDNQTKTIGALHGPKYNNPTQPVSKSYEHNLGVSVDADYHIYAIEWDRNGIRWFVDKSNFYSVTKAEVQKEGPWVYDQPFWLLLNVAVGGNLPGSPDDSSSFPQRMYVDYIRVYQ